MNKNKFHLKYMRNLITEKGLESDPDNIKAILNLETPGSKDELKRFLGMVSYLSQFIPNLAKLNANLREVLKKEVVWHWGENQARAFRNLKRILTEAPVLKYFNPESEIIIQTDAPENGLGVCLMQTFHPVAYASRSFEQIEKELLSSVFGMENYHHCVYGKTVTVQTDHTPLHRILKKEIWNPRRTCD